MMTMAKVKVAAVRYSVVGVAGILLVAIWWVWRAPATPKHSEVASNQFASPATTKLDARRPSTAPSRPGSATGIGDQFFDLPPDFFGADNTDEAETAYREAVEAGLSLPPEEAVKHYEQYIAEYPRSPQVPLMMSRLGLSYARLGQYDKGRQQLEAAKALVGENRFANILEINLAWIDTEAGNVREAEERLREVMDSQVVGANLKDPYSIAPQAFIAPTFLAKLRAKQGLTKEADDLLRRVADRAAELAHTNTGAETEWIVSYAGAAHGERIGLVLSADANNTEAAKAIVEDMRRQFPDYVGPYGWRNLELVVRTSQNNLRRQAEQTTKY